VEKIMQKAIRTALSKPHFWIDAKTPARERAERINLQQSEEQIREQIVQELESHAKVSDAALVWDAMHALRITEQQAAVMASLVKVNSMKVERLEREARRSHSRKKKREPLPALRPVPDEEG
jgi:arginine deiminase